MNGTCLFQERVIKSRYISETMKLLVDVHCHIDDKKFSNVDEVVDRAKEAGVVSIINCGLDHESNMKTLELSKQYDIVNAALGMYPDMEHSEEEIDFIEKNIQEVIAISEIGLDYKNCRDKEKQKQVFSRMIELGKKYDKPLIVHSREAEHDTIELLEKAEAKKVVMHCFNGSIDLAKRCVELGYFFSIPPRLITNEHFQRLVDVVPLSHLLTETDAPYMGSEKGKLNEPANVVLTVEKIADIKSMDKDEVAKNIYFNYQRLFS